MGHKDRIEIGSRPYAFVAAVIFLMIAVMHGLRAYYGWEIVFNGWIVPMELSWLIALVGFLMSITAIRKLH